MRAVSLVAVDLDGTLLTSAGTLAAEGAQILRQVCRAGVHVVLATTRNPDSVLPICQLLEINEPIICTNGAQVWGSPNGPVWAHHTLPVEIALAIAQFADAHGWELSTTVGSMTYWRQRPGQALGPFARNVTIVATNRDGVIGAPVRILAHQREAIDAISSLCRTELAGQCRTETFFRSDGSVHSLGIFALRADKGTALALVLERLKVGREEVMAIGDNVNDVPMFTHSRVSVAMGNAPEQVKQMATAVAPGNDQEGVAWAMKRFVMSSA